MSKRKVFLVCSGLGVINRGYESFTRECFDVLVHERDFDILLFKGGGERAKNETILWNLNRNGRIAKFLSRSLNKQAYYFEQLSFFVSLIPNILFKKPQIIYLSDFLLGCWLYHLKRFLNLKYKILFSNGAPNGPPFHCFDKVQQLLTYHFNIAINGGELPYKHVIIPYGLKIDQMTVLADKTVKNNIKSELNIPSNRKIILSVGAINIGHKRMDYLIREYANLDTNKYFLVIIGQKSEESDQVFKLAEGILPSNSYVIKSVPYEEVNKYYQMADIFVLASLSEGLPRVILEACAYGLPIVCHDYSINREILNEFGIYIDMSQDGSLANELEICLEIEEEMIIKEKRSKYIYDHFSWDVLKGKYIEFMKSSLN